MTAFVRLVKSSEIYALKKWSSNGGVSTYAPRCDVDTPGHHDTFSQVIDSMCPSLLVMDSSIRVLVLTHREINTEINSISRR